MRHKQKRFYEWSPELAYTVGLMTSDGCLSQDGRHLDLTSVDIDQLENFSKALGRSLPISLKLSGSLNIAFRMQFSDVAYYDFLVAAGLTPVKSKTMGPLNIPDKYYPAFLRGLFDGDGSTYGYFDPRWPTSFVFYVSITSASKQFLKYILSTNHRLIKTQGSSIRVGLRAFNLVYGKSDSLLLYNSMYEDENILFLERKRIKLEGFIKQDKDATISRLNARVVKLANTQP